DAGVPVRKVAGVPGELRQRGGEVHGVLAGAAADLEHRVAVAEPALEHGEDRFAIAFAGGREGAHGAAMLRASGAGATPTRRPPRGTMPLDDPLPAGEDWRRLLR